MTSGQPQDHTLEPGCTYWVDTADGLRHRLDLSSPGEIWFLTPTSADTSSTAGTTGDWIRVLDKHVTVTRNQPMNLLLAGTTADPVRWASASVTGLTCSSKASLPGRVEWATESG